LAEGASHHPVFLTADAALGFDLRHAASSTSCAMSTRSVRPKGTLTLFDDSGITQMTWYFGFQFCGNVPYPSVQIVTQSGLRFPSAMCWKIGRKSVPPRPRNFTFFTISLSLMFSSNRWTCASQTPALMRIRIDLAMSTQTPRPAIHSRALIEPLESPHHSTDDV